VGANAAKVPVTVTVAATNKAKVLVVDDDPDLRALADLQLKGAFEVLQAANGEQCVALAQSALPDVILLDMMMPGMNGSEVLERLSDDPSTKDIPVIFMSALADTKHKVDGLEQGAVDYIAKPAEPREFVARVGAAARIKSRQEELRRAGSDAVTGLPDRQAFESRLEQESSRARRKRSPLTIFLLDIDGMEAINESLGRDAGDLAIKAAADSLMTTLRTSDIVFRYGPGEFAAILPEAEASTAYLAAERCRKALHDRCGGRIPSFTVSIGISELTATRGKDEMVSKAELALFRARESGGDRTWRSDDPRKHSLSPLALAEGLTEREWSVLIHLSERRTEQDIGRRMGIRPGTVRSHKARIRRKLDIPADRRLSDYARDTLGELIARMGPIDLSEEGAT
jgi:diguanylate cyclase (GGDEF)-like protein